MRTRWDAMRAGDVSVPVNDHLGFEVDPAGDPTEHIALSWTVPAEYCNSAGQLQGGMLAAFVDALLGGATSAHLPEDTYPALAEMKISILRPAPEGMALDGKGYVVKAGRRVLFAEAEVRDGKGRLIAKASGTEIPAQA